MAKLRTSRLLLFLLLLMIIFIIIGYVLIQEKEKNSIDEAINAVPVNAAFVLEVNNITNFNQQLLSNSKIWQELLSMENLEKFKTEIFVLDSIFVKYSEMQRIFKKNKVIISSHLIGTDTYAFLLASKINNKKDLDAAVSNLLSMSISDDTTTITKKYNGVNIYTLKGYNNNYYFSVINDILILSKSDLVVESSIRQKSSNISINSDKDFSEISRKLSNNSDHLFINYSNFGQIYSKFFNSSSSRKVKKLQKFANWAGFDININQNNLSLTGFSYTTNSHDYYLKIFDNSETNYIDNSELFPMKTAEFITFSFSDISKLYTNYEKFINSKNLAGTYNEMLKKINTDFKIDLEVFAFQQICNSITFLRTNYNKTNKNLEQYSIINIKNPHNFKTYLNNITAKYKTDNNISKNYSFDYELDNNTTHKIYKLPFTNLIQVLFGELIDIPEQSYYFFYDDYVIFSTSFSNAKLLLNDIYRKKTLKYNESYQNFMNNYNSSSNILYYTNTNFNSQKILNSLANQGLTTFKQNINFFNKLQHIAIQFIYKKENLYQSNIFVEYNEDLSSKGISIWETELHGAVSKKPVSFINHYTFEKEIFIHDDDTLIYLLNKNGNIIWKKKLSEKIVGDIHVVDLYNNKKYQFLFATKSYVMAIDRNGELVENYPITLPTTTKIGLSLVDYDGTNDYRLFIPCTDNNIYLYNKFGEKIDGWQPKTSSTSIISKIYFFRNNNIDYLVFADKTKPRILNRKGEKKIDISQNFPTPDNTNFYFQKQTNQVDASFITSTASGKIVHILLNGKVKTLEMPTVSKNHYFVARDLNNDKRLDYIISDLQTLFVYNSDGTKLFSYTFKNNIEYKPIILKFSTTDIEIGVVIPAENKVYMFDLKGNIENNFPLPGNSPFSVGHFCSEKDFDLIVGNNNYIYNYLIYK